METESVWFKPTPFADSKHVVVTLDWIVYPAGFFISESLAAVNMAWQHIEISGLSYGLETVSSAPDQTFLEFALLVRC